MESLVTDGKLLLKEYGKIKVLCNLDLAKSNMIFVQDFIGIP